MITTHYVKPISAPEGAFVMSSIYQVGKQQFNDWIENHDVQAGSVDDLARVERGGYVLVYMVARFGVLLPGVQVGRFFRNEGVAREYLRKCEESKRGCTSLRADYELWEIVDDGDLWQLWDYESGRACREGGQPTDYHVYEGSKCVLDLVREVPSMLYVVTVVDGAEQIVSEEWYCDADMWADAVSFATVNGNFFMSLEHQTAGELGVYVVDDWDRDEGLADGVAVLNAYYRDYRSE